MRRRLTWSIYRFAHFSFILLCLAPLRALKRVFAPHLDAVDQSLADLYTKVRVAQPPLPLEVMVR